MRIRARYGLVAVVGAMALAGAAFASSVTLPTLLAHQIVSIKRDTHAPPILLPASMPIGFGGQRLYPEGVARGAGYSIKIGAVPNCNADACFDALFGAQTGGKLVALGGFKAVTVRGASGAVYHGLQCGGSCSPPAIEYIVHGVLYSIQANLNVRSAQDRATMIGAAQASISAGPR